MKKIIPLTIVMLLSICVKAQENITLSLDQAIDYALNNNYSVINANKDIDIAKKQKWETTTMGLPQISAAVDYQNWIKQQVSLIPSEIFGGEAGEYTEISFSTKQTLSATATLNQLIFDGSYIVGLQSAKVYLQISENAKEKTELSIREAAINAYGNVLISEESVRILNQNVASLQKTLNETNEMYKSGFNEEEDVEQLQITLASIKSNLSRTEKLTKIAYQMLNITLGIDINTNTTLTDKLNELAQKYTSITSLSQSFNVEEHIDYKIAKNTEYSNELLVKLEQSKALPTLSSYVNFAYAGYGDNDFDFLKKEQQWYDSSLLGISLNVPIFSSLGRSASTQKAKIKLDKAKTDLLKIQQNLLLKVESAKTDYNFYIEELETSKENLALAQRIENKQQIKFVEGISSSFELAQAQRQLYAMQQNYLQAMLNLINSKAALDNALNTPINN